MNTLNIADARRHLAADWGGDNKYDDAKPEPLMYGFTWKTDEYDYEKATANDARPLIYR